MFKSLPTRLVLSLFLTVCSSPLFAQSVPCPTGAALLLSSDPAYADAMELARILEIHNFAVNCIFPTKFGSVFMVDNHGTLQSTVEGEACFRTDRGDIGVVFLPKSQTFANFKIAERRKDRGYIYKFSGTPRVLHEDQFDFGTAHRQYFLKRDNKLIVVDDKLRASVQEALKLPSVP